MVECYESVCRVVSDSNGEMSRDAILERGREALTNAHRLGLSEHPEAANPATLANAVDLLVGREILVPVAGAPSGSKARYARGDAWESLGKLHELLARLALSR